MMAADLAEARDITELADWLVKDISHGRLLPLEALPAAWCCACFYLHLKEYKAEVF